MLESRDSVYLGLMKKYIPYLDSDYTYFLVFPGAAYVKVTIREKQATLDLVLLNPFGGLHYREVLQRVFQDCYIIYVYILDSNVRSKRFVSGVGFQCDGRLRKHVGGEDLIIYSLIKQEFEKHVGHRRA